MSTGFAIAALLLTAGRCRHTGRVMRRAPLAIIGPALPACQETTAVSSRAGLEVRGLEGDLVAREGEEVAAVDLELGAVGSSASEHPFRDTALTRHEVSGLVEARVREGREHSRESFAHPLAAGVPRPARLGSCRALEDAIVGHERHELIDIVPVPAFLEEALQLGDSRHGLPSSCERAEPPG